MNISGTPEKTPPVPRKMIRGEYGGEHRWFAQDRTVIENKKHYLDRSKGLEVDIEELEYYLLGPNELDVDMRCLDAQGEQQRREKGTSDFLGATVARWMSTKEYL